MMYPSPRQFLLTPPNPWTRPKLGGFLWPTWPINWMRLVNFARPLSRPMARVV